MIVFRTPKGWTGPREVDGLPVEGTWRAHQVPLAEVRTNPQHLRQLEGWLRSYRPEELFDEQGTLLPELAAVAPAGERRMSANPKTNGGLVLRDLELPDFRAFAVAWSGRGPRRPRRPACSGAGSPRSCARTRRTSASSAPTRRPRTGSATCSRSPTSSGTPASSRRTSRSPRAAASSRCSRSTSARAGWRAISSPGGTASSTATRRSSTSSTRCSTNTRSG